MSDGPVSNPDKLRAALEHSRTMLSAAAGLPKPSNITIEFDTTIAEIDEALAALSANTAGGDGLKLAREIYDLVSAKVSRAEYEAEELQNPKAWDEIAGWSRDGTLASFRQSIEELERASSPANSGQENQ